MANYTIQDIARMANVSPSSVSRVLSGKPGVNKAKRAEIQRIIKETGYIPSEIARSLVRGKSHVTALVVNDLSNQYYSSMAVAFQDELRKFGYIPLVINVGTNSAYDDDYLSEIIKLFDFAGMFISVPTRIRGLEDALKSSKCPLVLLNRTFGISCDQVIQDDYMAGEIAAKHLLSLNHKHVALLAGPVRESISCQMRLEGYKTTLIRNGITIRDEDIITCRLSMESAEAESSKYFDKLIGNGESFPSAIFVCGNNMALGLLRCCARYQISIPEDLAIVTNDNPMIMDLPSIDITTISISMEDMAREAVDTLRNRIENPKSTFRYSVLIPELTVRGSSGGVRPGEN